MYQRPDHHHLNAQIAASNRRVSDFLDSLIWDVDAVTHAATHGNWRQVAAQCQELAARNDDPETRELRSAARELAAAASEPTTDATELKRRVMKLIGASGRMGKPQGEPPSAERSA